MKAFALALAALLAGCGSLRTPDNSAASVFASPLPPETVHQNIVTSARSCFDRGNLRVTADFFSGSHEGSITLGHHAMFMNGEYFRIVIKPVASGSEVALLGQDRSFDRFVPEWIVGRRGDC